MVWIGLHGVMFLFLFSDFYKQSYINKRKNKLKAEQESTPLNGKVHYNDANNHCLVNIIFRMIQVLRQTTLNRWTFIGGIFFFFDDDEIDYQTLE